MNEVLNLSSMIDFTLLDARATYNDIKKLCDIAYKNQYYAVCVNPCNVCYAKGYIENCLLNNLKVVTVIGFPLGANSIEIKLAEAKQAFIDGADEIDVVINIGRLKDNDIKYVSKELMQLKKLAKKHIVKAIIETCYLDKNEILKICNICINAKIDYIKTSTGFGIGGANVEDIKFIANIVKGKCKIKAAGGIKSKMQAIELVNLGANRIGTSRVL